MRRFGLLARAAHLNGTVRDGETVRMWIARRSPAKPIDPGKLDNLVGGGIASGSSARQTLAKECWEEAGIAHALALQATYAGRLSICRSVDNGLHHESLIVFDLELPADLVPRNHDGEVTEFMLLGVAELAARLAAGEFTVDAGTVAIDWLARHALAGGEPELPALLARLREPGPE
jgi:8-oxo-dGTP pyrophosphatase MutT (NUDIX family)